MSVLTSVQSAHWFLDPCFNISHSYCDATLTIRERVADLVARLTVDEMISMVTTGDPVERPAEGVQVPPLAGSELGNLPKKKLRML